MTAQTIETTNARSAYPFAVDDLLPAAQRLAAQLGEIPSRNQLKKHLKVGSPKANAVLAALRESGFDPADPRADVARLHLVTEDEDAEPAPATSSRKARMPKPAAAPVSGPPAAAKDAGARPADVRPADLTPAPTPVRPAETPAAEAAEAPVARRERRPVAVWPVLLLALPAGVAIWGGWVGLGTLTGFGEVNLLPGIVADGEWATLNTAITLPIGMEAYAAYALRVWLSGQVPSRARRFARVSALAALALGALGQVAYHLMAAAEYTAAPWLITTLVACLPVAVLGMGAALAHLIRDNHGEDS